MTMSELELNYSARSNDHHSEHDHSNYSDGFESEESSNHEIVPGRPSGRRTKMSTIRQSWRHNLMHVSSNFRTNSTASFGRDDVSQRILSAKRLKLNELRNEIQSLQMRMKELEEENRMLKRVQKLQEKELMKYDSKKGELPDIYRSHNHEVYTLQNQLRQAKSRNTELEKNLNSRDRQLARREEEIKRLQKMVDEQGLQEKKDLVMKIDSLEDAVKQKDSTIQHLKQQKEMAAKTHKRDLGVKATQVKDLQKTVAELRNQNEKQAFLLKEKDKELLKLAMQGPQKRLPSKMPFLEQESSLTSTSDASNSRRGSAYEEDRDIALPLVKSPIQSVGLHDKQPTESIGRHNESHVRARRIDLGAADLPGGNKKAAEPKAVRDGNEEPNRETPPSEPKNDDGITWLQTNANPESSPRKDKKENFLEKLEAIQDKVANGTEELNQLFAETDLNRDKKKDLLARLKAIDNDSPKHGNDTQVATSTSRRAVKDEFAFGSYQPSFRSSPGGRRTSNSSTEEGLKSGSSSSGSSRKVNLMSTLFGNSIPEIKDTTSVQSVYATGSDSPKKVGLPWA